MNRIRKIKEAPFCVLVSIGILLVVGKNAKADFIFGTPTNLGPPINSPLNDSSAMTSADGLTMLFTRWPASRETLDFMKVTRSADDAPWDTPVNLGPPNESFLNRAGVDYMLSFYTADGLEAYAGESRADGYGNLDLWVFKRDTVDDDWGPMINLGPVVNSARSDNWPTISRDGLELYFQSYNRSGGHGHWDIWVTRRDSRDAPWTEPTNLGPLVNTSSLDARPCLAPDGLILFFDSKRPGGYGICDLYMTKRASLSDPWEQAVNLGSVVNGSGYDEVASISGDGCTLYFDSDRAGGYGLQDIWQVSIEPVVDLNSDGIVDADDMCIIVENWGTDNKLCDIAPKPFGDGIVDVQDLFVLTEYLAKPDVEADITAIKEVINQYSLAVNTGDLDLFISIHTDDTVNMAPEFPATIGKEELRSSMEPFFSNFTAEMTLYPEEAQVDGDLGFARGTYILVTTPKKGGESSFADGKYLTICKRQTDGSWKISRECFNSNVPIAH